MPPDSRTPTLELLRRQLAAMRAAGEASREPDRKVLLDKLASMAAEATSSDRAGIYLLDAGGKTMTLVGTHGYTGDLIAKYETIPSDGPTGRALELLTARAMGPNDWPESIREDLAAGGFRAYAVAPLHSEQKLIGTLNLARTTDRPYSPDDILASEIVAQEVTNQLENLRLRREARRRADDLALIHELGQMIAAELDLKTVLEIGVKHLARIADVPQAFLFLFDEASGGLRMVAADSDIPDATNIRIERSEDSLPMQAFLLRRPLLVADVDAPPEGIRFSRERVARFHQHALMAVPLLARGVPIGAAMLGETRPERPLTTEVLERTLAMANQLATAMANARLVEDLRRSYRELEEAQHLSIQRERLAALGELAASVAHEVRNPLAVIFNSLGSLERHLPACEDAHTLHRIATEEAHRLNGIVGELLAFARPTEPQLHAQALGPVLSGAIEAAANELGIAPARVVTTVDADVGAIPIDAQLVRQALINLLANAFQAAGRAGTVDVTARKIRVDERLYVEIAVHNDGAPIPEDVAPQIFQPFFTTKPTGAGLGLAIVKRIAEAHRGEVSFVTDETSGTTFRLRLRAEPR